jgi:capsular exopolysaccharide synthesis family protein
VPLASQDELNRIVRAPKSGGNVSNYLLESFRLIRSNLILHPNRSGISQVIMVASARPGEGKTTCAANLAWSFYSMGESTLLVDCDLRRGMLHRALDVRNDVGLATLFSGELTEDGIVQETQMDDLWLVPRGPVIPGATEWLCSVEFASLVARWRKKYSRIVIDTPPILGLSETISIQRVVDGVVFIVQAEKTSRKDLQDAISLLKKSGAHLFGFVLNRVDLKKLANHYNYYHYSSHYYDSVVGQEDDASTRKSPRPA